MQMELPLLLAAPLREKLKTKKQKYLKKHATFFEVTPSNILKQNRTKRALHPF